MTDSAKTANTHGLIYPSYDVDGKIMSVEIASIVAHFCAYCGAEL